jgi:hypothetical protein
MMGIMLLYRSLTLNGTTPSQQTRVTTARMILKEGIAFADRSMVNSENMTMDWVKALAKGLEQARGEENDLERVSVTRENPQDLEAFSHCLEQELAPVPEREDCLVCISKLPPSYSYLSSCRRASWINPGI